MEKSQVGTGEGGNLKQKQRLLLHKIFKDDATYDKHLCTFKYNPYILNIYL